MAALCPLYQIVSFEEMFGCKMFCVVKHNQTLTHGFGDCSKVSIKFLPADFFIYILVAISQPTAFPITILLKSSINIFCS